MCPSHMAGAALSHCPARDLQGRRGNSPCCNAGQGGAATTAGGLAFRGSRWSFLYLCSFVQTAAPPGSNIRHCRPRTLGAGN